MEVWDYHCSGDWRVPPLDFRGHPHDSQLQGVWEEGSGSCVVGESVGGLWFGRRERAAPGVPAWPPLGSRARWMDSLPSPL